jgi:hypothetical protein
MRCGAAAFGDGPRARGASVAGRVTLGYGMNTRRGTQGNSLLMMVLAILMVVMSVVR